MEFVGDSLGVGMDAWLLPAPTVRPAVVGGGGETADKAHGPWALPSFRAQEYGRAPSDRGGFRRRCNRCKGHVPRFKW